MRNIELMEAIAGIDGELLIEAEQEWKRADNAGAISSEEEEQVLYLQNRKKRRSRRQRLLYAAACLALFSVAAPNVSERSAYALQGIPVLGEYFDFLTFRKYSFKEGEKAAEVSVPELSASGKLSEEIRESAARSAAGIRQEMEAVTDQLIREFEQELSGRGYKDLAVSFSVETDTADWFSIRLISTLTSADSVTESRYYTVRKRDGKRISLSELFRPGTDYRRVILENVRAQMLAQREADPGKSYWLGTAPEDPVFEIGEDQSFYINASGQLVICFREGEAAPMSMGELAFVMPDTLEGLEIQK